MRNCSSVVSKPATIHWFADTDMRAESGVYRRVLCLFNRYFENPVSRSYAELSPSEQRVIRDFLRYASQCRHRSSDYAKDHPGSFVYINLNTGHSVVFVTWYGYGDFAGGSIDW